MGRFGPYHNDTRARHLDETGVRRSPAMGAAADGQVSGGSGEMTVAEQESIGVTIRVVLVDDHLAFRQALAFMLLREPDITIIGQAGTVAEARPLLAAADIALIDLHLPDGEGMVLLHELNSLAPQAIAVLLTGD